MAATTILHRITAIVTKLGNANGTKLVVPDYSGDEPKNNEAVTHWMNEWAVLGEHMVASVVAKIAEARLEKAKDNVKTVFGKTLKDVKIGDSVAVVRGNITTTFNRRNGQRRINRQAVINTLTIAPYNWELEKIQDFLNKIEQAPPEGALYITASTTME